MEKAIDFNKLNNMACNTEVHIQLLTNNAPIQLETHLIGIDSNKSVILAIANTQDWLDARKHLNQGGATIVSIGNMKKSDAEIITFRSNIQKISSISDNWLIMDYPKELKKVAIRKYPRVSICVECTIINEKDKSELSRGFAHNISNNGCAFIGESLEEGAIDCSYLLRLKFMKDKRNLVIPVTVKNIMKNKNQIGIKQYGLLFDESKQETRDFVQYIRLHHLS